MKLLNLNIGILINNADKIAQLINNEKPDFITLQEVTRHLDDGVDSRYKSKESIESQLADNYEYRFFGPLWESDGFKTPTKLDRFFGGHIEQGNHILSKSPIVSGSSEFFHRHFEYLQDWSNWKEEDHGRALLITTINVEGKLLQVITLHGIWTQDKVGDDRTLAECKYIVEAAKRSDLPTVITGDFNLLPNTESIKIMNDNFRNLNNEYAIKTTRPHFQDEVEHGGGMLDYVFVNDKIKVNSFEVKDTNISDHLPLVVEFELP